MLNAATSRDVNSRKPQTMRRLRLAVVVWARRAGRSVNSSFMMALWSMWLKKAPAGRGVWAVRLPLRDAFQETTGRRVRPRPCIGPALGRGPALFFFKEPPCKGKAISTVRPLSVPFCLRCLALGKKRLSRAALERGWRRASRLAAVTVLKAHDVVFPQIGPGLDFDDHKRDDARIFQPMDGPERDVVDWSSW